MPPTLSRPSQRAPDSRLLPHRSPIVSGPCYEPNRRDLIRIGFVSFACCLILMGSFYLIAQPWRTQLRFDDAFMFTRYIRNFKHGLGISWNPDGVHTYGMTSLPWMFWVLPFTSLLNSQESLQTASWAAMAIGLSAIVYALAANARTPFFRNPCWVSLIVVAPLLLLTPAFRFHVFTGMDTSMALACNSLLTASVLGWRRDRVHRGGALRTGILAFFAACVRPDGALCALCIPLLVWRTHKSSLGYRQLLACTCLPICLITFQLTICKMYFGNALPLSFYAKSIHAYSGFLNPESAGAYLGQFLLSAALPIGLALAVAKKRDIEHVLPFLIPSVLTIAYLLTVKQIMGEYGRFYFPLLPYLLVPGFLTIDRRFGSGEPWRRIAWFGPKLGYKLAVVALCSGVVCGANVYRKRSVTAIPVPKFARALPLPRMDWFRAIKSVATVGRLGLGQNGVMAASEVGYLGDSLPKVDIIDLAGLNEPTIGLRGFTMNDFLARKPDLIWFPHWDYTGLRATMFSDPRLFRQYVVIAGAFNYGIAIRRDSRDYAVLMHAVSTEWTKLYPGHSIDSYVAPFPD
jgi:hypothetical protein